MASLGMLGAQCCLLPVYFDVRQESLYVIVLSHVRLFATLWTIGHQAALSMGFPRQEYRSGLPFPPPFSQSRDRTHVSYVSCIGKQAPYHYYHMGSPKNLQALLKSLTSPFILIPALNLKRKSRQDRETG